MKVIYYLFLIFCFFPFLNVLRIIPTDSQPNALLVAIPLILLSDKRKIPIPIFLFLLMLLFSIGILPFFGLNFNNMRSVITYFSIFFIPFATYNLLKRYGDFSKFLKASILVWFVTGFVQTYFYSGFLTFLLQRAISDAKQGRGVIALANEPSFYGGMCILFLAILLLNNDFKKVKWWCMLCFIQLVLFAKSSMALLTLLVAIFIFAIASLPKAKPRTIFYSILMIGVLLLGVNAVKNKFEGTRMYSLAEKLIQNPQIFIAVDQSVNARFINTFFPMKFLVDHHFKPGGYGRFIEYIHSVEMSQKTEKIYFRFKDNLPREGEKSRIKSGYGAVLFQLGGVGLFLPLGIFIAFKKIIKRKEVFFAYILFNLLLFSAIVFNTATLGFIIGNAMYLSYKEHHLESS